MSSSNRKGAHDARTGIKNPWATVICMLLTMAGHAWSETPPRPDPSDNLDGMAQREESGSNSIPDTSTDNLLNDDLLLFQDIPIIVSASRQAQPINQSSIPVTVITREDIHYSGLNTIPEILQFYTGVDVLKMDNLRYGVGVRGLHGSFSDRTLVLLDGRPIYNPAWGGMEWFRLPILVEDIERMEIVHGPGGAAWGANAYTGVINIITVKPGGRKGWLLSETVDQWGDNYSHVRWSERKDKWSWRQSIGYTDQATSEDTVEQDRFSSRDFNRQILYDGRVSYQASEETLLDFGLSYARNRTGGFELMGYNPRESNLHHTGQIFTQLTHDFSDTVTGQLRWSSSNLGSRAPYLIDRYCVFDNDLEGQLNVKFDDHELTLGSNVRLTQLTFNQQNDEEMHFEDSTYHEQWAGLFAIDRWSISEKFVLEGQLRGDWYSGTGEDWSSRLTGLYSLDDKKDHILRLSTAKAFRAPTVGFREVSGSRIPLPLPPPLPQDLYGFNLVRPGDLNNEETWSLEAGYNARLTREWMFKLDGYYQKMSDLIGGRPLADPLGLPVRRSIITLDNTGDADTYGAETELSWTREQGKIAVWYAYNDLVREQGERQNVRAFLPAKHKCGLTGRLNVTKDWIFNANYRFSGVTPSDSITYMDTGETHRLDLTLARIFMDRRGEWLFGVTNVLNNDSDTVMEDGQLTGHETAGRRFFSRVQMQF